MPMADTSFKQINVNVLEHLPSQMIESVSLITNKKLFLGFFFYVFIDKTTKPVFTRFVT